MRQGKERERKMKGRRNGDGDRAREMEGISGGKRKEMGKEIQGRKVVERER